MVNFIDVYDFGAVGDGINDDTIAIQKAIDEGAKTGKTVFFMPGKFKVGELFVRPNSVLRSNAQWGFRFDTIGNSVLIQKDENQECILDVSNATGATLDGLSLSGEGLKGLCHGILSRKKDQGTIEDAYRIQNCRVAKFSGHAVFLDNVWCFSARHNMFCFSNGDGLHIHGFDAFVSDNWFSGNKGAGFGTSGENCSVTMTGNRIEWNQGGGIVINGGSHYNITGNYIDRSGKSGIVLTNQTQVLDSGEIIKRYSNTITCTGNIIYRSGKNAKETLDNTHLLMEHCVGISVVGNSFCVGRDDRGVGDITPNHTMILNDLHECIVSNNTMFSSCTKECIIDYDNHTNSIIENNIGSVCPQNVLTSNKPNLPSNIAVEEIFK